MARETIQKRAYCKSATFLQAQRGNLQTALSEALVKKKKIGQRKQIEGDDQKYVSSIIYHRTAGNMLFGVLAAYERGTHQLTIAEDDNAESISVEQVAPPARDDKKRREFLEGICYFGVFKNHVILVGSRAVDAKDMERYINWLMLGAKTIADEDRVMLSDQISAVTRNKILSQGVKAIKIGGPLVNLASEDEVEGVATKNANVQLDGFGMDVLRRILGDSKVDRLKLSDAIDGNIELSLRISYKRKTTEKARKVLDTLALAARNLPGEEVSLELAKGGSVRGGDLKLSKMLSVNGRDGIVDHDDLFPKMQTYLKQLLDDAIING